jgi:Ca2+-binding RTX toxin-like protein
MGVLAQRYDHKGLQVGGELLVNATTAGDQTSPSLADLAGGGFAIAWTDYSGTGADGSQTAVYARVFDAAGTALGAELPVNSTTAGAQETPRLAGLAGGGLVAVWADWSETGGDGSSWSVRAQRFDAAGAKLGGELLVNTTTSNSQLAPAVAALSGGGFAAVWEDRSASGQDGSASAIRAQLFGADGQRQGTEILVNATTQLGQDAPTLAALPGGGFVVAWQDGSGSGGDTSGTAIRAQVFGADGSRSGLEILVNGTTAGDQGDPTVAVLADGRFVVGWTDWSSSGGDPSESAVRARIFDPRGAAVSLPGTPAADQYIGTRFGDTLAGGRGRDRLNGGLGNDRLDGGASNDRLWGAGGNDTLNGGAGADTLAGGAGDDSYRVDRAGDLIVELVGEGIDQAGSSTVSVDLAPYGELENGGLSGSAPLDLSGNALGNRLLGNAGANRLAGRGGHDSLSGAGGADTLAGGAGDDTLAGGGGNDSFSFDLAPGAGGIDSIASYSPWADTILLAAAAFPALPLGTLAAAAFRKSASATQATDASDRIVYNTTTGALYWDGDGKGGAAAVQFATLAESPDTLTRLDFTVG